MNTSRGKPQIPLRIRPREAMKTANRPTTRRELRTNKTKKPRSVHYKQLRGFPLRFLADSNRRTWFCRPLTKPLIQGTESIKNKSNFQLPRGSWRIRTAVHGFADRWLSHSSKEPLSLVCGCKGSTNFEITNYPQQFFFVLFLFTLHSLCFFSIISLSSQPLTQLSQGLVLSWVRRKKV